MCANLCRRENSTRENQSVTAAATTAISSTTTAIAPTVPPTAATAIAASTATAATLARTCFVDDNVAAHEILAVERLHRASGLFVVRDFDETKAPELSGCLVSNQSDGGS